LLVLPEGTKINGHTIFVSCPKSLDKEANDDFASGAVERLPAGRDTDPMPKKARPHSKPARQRTFIREWRKHRGYTLERFSDALQTMLDLDISYAQISRIERGDQPYSQDLLEAFARVLQCEPNHLLRIDPTRGEDVFYSVYDRLSPVQRRQAQAMLRVIAGDSTGTDD